VLVDVHFKENMLRAQINTAQESRNVDPLCTDNPYKRTYYNLGLVLRPFTDAEVILRSSEKRITVDERKGRGMKVLTGYGYVKVKEKGRE
jgi:hypothetical protein